MVFTDIEGSTKLLRVLGDRFDALLARHHELLRQAMSAGGGVEVSTEGDSFFVLFEQPVDAVLACVSAQRLLAAEPWPQEGQIRVRMGIHLGEVRRGGDNYIGMGIHQGARVAPAAHGGQVIVSAAMAAALGEKLPEAVGLLDLGAFVLRDFDDPEHLFQVLHPDLERSFPPARVPSAAVHNLAPQRTSFVGRSAELDELVKATDVIPLVTIVGPGGVGKTRLAAEVGLLAAGRYPQGVWMVPLASIDSSDAVAEHVKTTLGLVDRPGLNTTQVIAERFSSGPGMIILDNCEHVLDGCVHLVEGLVKESATTTMLATSREHLGVLGEQVFRLGPLELTADAHFGAGGAVELFVARGAQSRRGFIWSEDNAAVIESVCRRLDGIPLALELAAARLSTMSLGQLHQRLDDALGLLGSGRRGGDDRQRTLRATLEWSHRLLSSDDQAVFKALSVFRGHFTLNAAEAVAGGDPTSAAVVAQSLERLVAQSLLELDSVADPPRYRLLETNRAYGAEHLEGAEATQLADRHAAFYADLAHAFAEEGETPETLGRLAADHPNLLGALEYLAGSERPADHGRLVMDLSGFWNVRGHWQLARQQQLTYLSRTGRDRTLDGQILGRLGTVASRVGDYPEARARLKEALVIARELGDQRIEGDWVGGLGSVAFSLGDYPEARARFEEALVIARQLGDQRNEGLWVGGLGSVAFSVGDYPAARARFEEALVIGRQLGDLHIEGGCVGRLGNVAFSVGDYPEARARFEEALAVARQLGNRDHEGDWVGRLGQVASALGDYPEARALLEEALAIARELGNRHLEGRSVGGLGEIASALGDYREARALLEEALAIARELGNRHLEGEWVGGLGEIASALGDHREARARLEEALAIARELGNRHLEGEWVGGLGEIASALGDHPEARALLEEALAIARELGDRNLEGRSVGPLGQVASEVGNYPEARARFKEALAISRELATQDCGLLEGCAGLLSMVDRCESAAALLGAADELNARAGKVSSVGDHHRYAAALATCSYQLEVDVYTSALERGHQLDWSSAAELALRVLAELDV